MEAIVLVKEIDKYEGKYVAIKDFTDRKPVTSGDDPITVYNKAVEIGIKDPVVFYVPKRDVAHIYLICR
jgi:hypothetical protein